MNIYAAEILFASDLSSRHSLVGSLSTKRFARDVMNTAATIQTCWGDVHDVHLVKMIAAFTAVFLTVGN